MIDGHVFTCIMSQHFTCIMSQHFACITSQHFTCIMSQHFASIIKRIVNNDKSKFYDRCHDKLRCNLYGKFNVYFQLFKVYTIAYEDGWSQNRILEMSLRWFLIYILRVNFFDELMTSKRMLQLLSVVYVFTVILN
jgi:hypothetical protein